jgi:hypothetical protein
MSIGPRSKRSRLPSSDTRHPRSGTGLGSPTPRLPSAAQLLCVRSVREGDSQSGGQRIESIAPACECGQRQPSTPSPVDETGLGAQRSATRVAERGHHDDRQRASSLARPKPSADFEARHAGQHPIENDEVERALGEAEFGFVAPFYALDEIALRFEIVSEQQRQIRFVLDDEDSGRGASLGASNLLARLVHTSPPAAPGSRSMSFFGRLCGRSVGIEFPVTR